MILLWTFYLPFYILFATVYKIHWVLINELINDQNKNGIWDENEVDNKRIPA